MNKHGLTRDIPEDIKRQVRQRDGFGCVVCGNAIIEYEHLDPEFKDATTHSPDGIILLCVACHAKKTRGLLSRATIFEWRERPATLQKGFSFGAFDVGSTHPTVHIGNVTASNTSRLLVVGGEEVLRIDPPERNGGPFRLSASIYDRSSELILRIVDNEWQTPTTNWDVELVGRRVTIRSAHRNVDLVLRSDPPNELVFERMRMNYRGVDISCAEGTSTIISDRSGMRIETARMSFDECEVAIDVSEGQCMLGRGGGSVRIDALSFGQALGSRQAAPRPRPRFVDDRQIDALVAARANARKEMNFGLADSIRKLLDEGGIQIMDGPEGSTWRRV